MDWTIFLGATLVASLAVALVAAVIARRIAATGGEMTFGPVLAAILVSFAVLMGAARLAVGVDWLFARAGIDPATALGGDFALMAYIASFVPIAAYVVTFLVVYRRIRQ